MHARAQDVGREQSCLASHRENGAVVALEQIVYERQREILEHLLRASLWAVEVVEGEHVHLGVLAGLRARVRQRQLRHCQLELQVAPALGRELLRLTALLLALGHRPEAHADLDAVARAQLHLRRERLGQLDAPACLA